MISETLKQIKEYPVYIIVSRLDTDIPETYLVLMARQFVIQANHSLA